MNRAMIPQEQYIREMARFYEASFTTEYRRALLKFWKHEHGEEFVEKVLHEASKRTARHKETATPAVSDIVDSSC